MNYYIVPVKAASLAKLLVLHVLVIIIFYPPKLFPDLMINNRQAISMIFSDSSLKIETLFLSLYFCLSILIILIDKKIIMTILFANKNSRLKKVLIIY